MSDSFTGGTIKMMTTGITAKIILGLVPASLYYIFQKESLGKYFLDESGEVDEAKVKDWIRREHLEMGFVNENSEVKDIIPLIEGLPTKEAKWLTKEMR